MRAADVVGRRIVAIRQERTATSRAGWDGKELEYAWDVQELILDNGTRVILHAIETDHLPIVTVHVVRKEKS